MKLLLTPRHRQLYLKILQEVAFRDGLHTSATNHGVEFCYTSRPKIWDFLGISITYKITTDVATFWQLLEIIGLLLGIIRLLFNSRLVTLVTTLADQKRTERK